MTEHRLKATVAGDGSITIRELPLRAGEEVEMVVAVPDPPGDKMDSDRRPLRGSVRRFERPFEPVSDASDWDAA